MPKTKEQCQKLRDEMKNTIITKSILFFAKNGFAGTKISELSKNIGIAQGTIYVYFESKEQLYQEIQNTIDNSEEIKQLKMLARLPMSASRKLHLLSEQMLKRLKEDELFAARSVINTQMMLEKSRKYSSIDTVYQSDLYQYTAKIIEKGQKEGSMVDGSPIKLADYYWGVVFLYALKRIYTTDFEMITIEDLERTIRKGEYNE
jgi:AcrR family transcriptional regulator